MSKKRTSFPHLDREVEEKIAEWFQGQEILYRADAEGYSNREMKNAVWAEGAQLIGIEEEHLRHFIRGMRTLYSKLVKPGKNLKGANYLSGRKRWTLKNFEFLRNHIQHRTSDSSKRGAKEETFEEDNDDGDDEFLVAVDCASDVGIQEGELNQYGTIDPLTESANGPDDPSVNNTASSAQRQVSKRPAELHCGTQLNRLRSTQQPIPNTAKRSRKSVSGAWSKFHMNSPYPVFTNHTRARMDEGEREFIRQFQIGESTKTDDPRKGMDDQVRSFLDMMGTTMMSLQPKRRHKAQRKLLNIIFDELEQQEKEDAQPSTSPCCTSVATSVTTSPPPHDTCGQ